MEPVTHPIGVFDSGYGGLTVLREIVAKLPGYDYLYLGDNGRAPYGSRSFETVYQYTLQSVQWLFAQGCPLVILACNTASAKALRSIQQKDLPVIAPDNRVLGVIRPTSEVIGNYTRSNKVGILATNGTVQSQSYLLEIEKFFPEIQVSQQACPIWVPLVENNEYENEGADYFIRKNVHQLLEKQPDIDTVLLACTHYPLLQDKIKQFLPANVNVVSQGAIVADSLENYLQRHPEMETRLSKGGNSSFYTTDAPEDFNKAARKFYGGHAIASLHVDLQ
ncbi:glutamate racemase [Filimonas effusa]|uniref:Glutamate racemase n=1 Tax=Filimonas effusa TaxID=2508721 RepID=A0A4Q1CZW0_9BACT|nr:glutamate racemase [Filimonas effusa]RXK80866.1 glutamate racemase [Filimonas effusa]